MDSNSAAQLNWWTVLVLVELTSVVTGVLASTFCMIGLWDAWLDKRAQERFEPPDIITLILGSRQIRDEWTRVYVQGAMLLVGLYHLVTGNPQLEDLAQTLSITGLARISVQLVIAYASLRGRAARDEVRAIQQQERDDARMSEQLPHDEVPDRSGQTRDHWRTTRDHWRTQDHEPPGES